MGAFSITHWLLFAGLIAFILWFPIKILKRMGYSGWWALTLLVPLLNIIMIWTVAFKSWPCEESAAIEGEYIPRGEVPKRSWSISEFAALFGTGGLMIAWLLFGLIQFGAGYSGIQHEWGTGWAIAACAVSLFFRFTLPLTVGAFYCALNIWEWHWFFAALFAAPGLLFIVPGFLSSIIAGATGQLRR